MSKWLWSGPLKWGVHLEEGLGGPCAPTHEPRHVQGRQGHWNSRNKARDAETRGGWAVPGDEAGAQDGSQIMQSLVRHIQDFGLYPKSNAKSFRQWHDHNSQFMNLFNKHKSKRLNLSALKLTGRQKWLEYFSMWRRGKYEKDLVVFTRCIPEAPHYNRPQQTDGSLGLVGWFVFRRL